MPPQRSIQAQPPLEFVPPNLQPRLIRGLGVLVPWFLKARCSIADFETTNVEPLVEMYRAFQSGKIRFMIAFRHPSSLDPISISRLLAQTVPQCASHMGVDLHLPTHAYFLYDRGVPLWAGPIIGWLLPRMGGISLQRGKLDRQSLRTARDKFANGDQPMMVAPEGATNGLNEIVSPLEPGAAQMAFWCLEDLRSKDRKEQVYVVPLGLRYSYISEPWEGVDALLAWIETDCGLQNDAQAERYARLTRIAVHLVTLLEDYYVRFYQQQLAPSADFGARLQNLLEAALRTSEQFFSIQPKGSVVDRCRRIEQAGWDRIYREDLKGQTLSPVQRGLADRAAEEADLRMWHMRLVETFVAVTGSYVRDNPTAERYAETVSLVYKTVQRLKGEASDAPPSIGSQRVRLTVGEPILIDDRYGAYTANRQGARQCVADLTKTLQESLEAMI